MRRRRRKGTRRASQIPKGMREQRDSNTRGWKRYILRGICGMRGVARHSGLRGTIRNP